jgi:hypothetical protein
MIHYTLKALLFGLFCFVSTAHNTNAEISKHLIGKWNTKGTIFVNGKKTAAATGSSTITRFGAVGFYAVATSKVAKKAPVVTHAWMYDNGSVSGYIMQQGSIVANLYGTWGISGRTLAQSLSIQSPIIGNYTQYTTLNMINKKRMDSVGTTNTGIRVVATNSKK